MLLTLEGPISVAEAHRLCVKPRIGLVSPGLGKTSVFHSCEKVTKNYTQDARYRRI